MKKSTFLLFTSVFVLAIAISSCKKKETPVPATTEDTTASSDNSYVEKVSNDIVSMAGQSSENGSLSSYRKSGEGEELCGLSCATIVRDTTTKTITITFDGKQCLDGHTRSGVLVLNYAGSNGAKYYRNPGYHLVITSSNYVVDGDAITVNKTIDNTTAVGFNPTTTNLTWQITSDINVVKANNGGTITWKGTRTKTLLNTSDTTVYHGQSIHISWDKARIGITGNATGTTAGGDNYTSTITSQLVRDMNCSPNALHPGSHPFIQGTFDFTPGAKLVRHFNFGSGACDNDATVTINNVVYNITLR